MEETFRLVKNTHLRKASHANFWKCSDTLILLVLPKVIRGKFVTGKLTKEESFPSLSVTQNRTIHVHKVKHFIPQHSRVQNQVLAHGLLATRAK